MESSVASFDRLLLSSWAVMFMYNVGELGLMGLKIFVSFELNIKSSSGRESCRP